MPPSPAPTAADWPSRRALRRGLDAVLAPAVAQHGPFRIVHRRENPLVSSYVSDIVQVAFADGHRERLLCKFAHGRELTPPTPHLGLAHEVRVYEEILAACPLDLPRVHGGFVDHETGDAVLVMTYYPDAVPAGKSEDPAALELLVRWLARFHAWAEARVDESAWTFAPRLDAEWYGMWCERTCQAAASLGSEFSWLPAVADAYRAMIPTLLAAPRTVIHGEFTVRNALWNEGRILPIDWETTAIGPAEIDLAVLTYDWHPEFIEFMEATYVEERWQGSPPVAHTEALLAARLYAAFHWLFGTPGGVGPARIRDHLGSLRAEAIRWGILSD